MFKQTKSRLSLKSRNQNTVEGNDVLVYICGKIPVMSNKTLVLNLNFLLQKCVNRTGETLSLSQSIVNSLSKQQHALRQLQVRQTGFKIMSVT